MSSLSLDSATYLTPFLRYFTQEIHFSAKISTELFSENESNLQFVRCEIGLSGVNIHNIKIWPASNGRIIYTQARNDQNFRSFRNLPKMQFSVTDVFLAGVTHSRFDFRPILLRDFRKFATMCPKFRISKMVGEY